MWTPLVWDSLNNYYVGIPESTGIWFINPDGSNLTMFLEGVFGSLDWHPNGEKILAPGREISIMDSSATLIPNVHSYPRYNSDGSKILYANYVGDSMGLWIVDSDGSNPRRIDNGEKGDWAPNGKELVYQRYPFYPTPLVISDTNGIVIEELPLPRTYSGMPLRWPPCFASDGIRIFFDYDTDSLLSNWQIYVINRDGTDLAQLTDDGAEYPVLSPDGSRITYIKHSFWGSEEDGDGQLWVMNADGSGAKQLTFVKEGREK